MYIEISAKVTISGWWLSPTPLTNMISSVGMMKFPIYGKKSKCSKPPTRQSMRFGRLPTNNPEMKD